MLKFHPLITFLIPFIASAMFIISFCLAQDFESTLSKEKIATKNPIKSCPESIKQGETLYSQYCKGCHGDHAIRQKNATCTPTFCPADLRNPKLWRLGEGAVYWTITDDRNPMPCFSHRLTDEQRWNIVNYLHSLTKEQKSDSSVPNHQKP